MLQNVQSQSDTDGNTFHTQTDQWMSSPRTHRLFHHAELPLLREGSNGFGFQGQKNCPCREAVFHCLPGVKNMNTNIRIPMFTPDCVTHTQRQGTMWGLEWSASKLDAADVWMQLFPFWMHLCLFQMPSTKIRCC